MRILALDPAGQVGYCYGDTETGHKTEAFPVLHGFKPLISGVWLEDKDLDLAGKEFDFLGWLREMIRGNDIEHVYYEMAFAPRGDSYNYATVEKAFGLSANIRSAASFNRIKTTGVPLSTWRASFGVKTRAPKSIESESAKKRFVKRSTIDKCRLLGANVIDHDEADAIALFHVAAWEMTESKKQRARKVPDLFSGLQL